jgi:hypothetical protein
MQKTYCKLCKYQHALPWIDTARSAWSALTEQGSVYLLPEHKTFINDDQTVRLWRDARLQRITMPAVRHTGYDDFVALLS